MVRGAGCWRKLCGRCRVDSRPWPWRSWPPPTEAAETAWQRREERRTYRQWQSQVAAANQGVHLDRAGLQCALRWAERELPALQQPEQRAAVWRRAAQGLLEGLDPHSSLVLKAHFEQAERQSARTLSADPGLRLEREGPDLYVASLHPLARLAAQKLRLGDRILAIDGQPTADWPPARAAQQLAAAPNRGGPVTLLVASARGPARRAPIEVVLPRLELQWPTVQVRVIERRLRVAVVRLPQFARLTAEQLRQGLREATALVGKPLSAVVLDMRGNGGGWLSEAIAVADAFASSGPLLTVRWRGLQEESYRAKAEAADLLMPLTVLVDGHCRSACEVVADALQGSGRALVAGQPTFGKGTLQVVEDARRGPWSVLVTRGIYAGPSGRSVQARGVQPDVLAGSDQALLREVDLPRALTPGDDVPAYQTSLKTEAWRACMAQPLPELAATDAYDAPLATAARAALCQEQRATLPRQPQPKARDSSNPNSNEPTGPGAANRPQDRSPGSPRRSAAISSASVRLPR